MKRHRLYNAECAARPPKAGQKPPRPATTPTSIYYISSWVVWGVFTSPSTFYCLCVTEWHSVIIPWFVLFLRLLNFSHEFLGRGVTEWHSVITRLHSVTFRNCVFCNKCGSANFQRSQALVLSQIRLPFATRIVLETRKMRPGRSTAHPNEFWNTFLIKLLTRIRETQKRGK